MYAKVFLTFAISILFSEGIPQEYTNSATTEKAADFAGSSDVQPNNAGTDIDHAWGNGDEPINADENDDVGPDNDDEVEEGQHDVGSDNDDEIEKGKYNERQNPTGGEDIAPPNNDDKFDYAGNDYTGAGGYNDAYNDADFNHENEVYPNIDYDQEYDYDSDKSVDGHLIELNQPVSSEILDRNKPEAGFDLSYDEMMKLKLWPDATIPYYIDVHSFNDKVMRDRIRSFLSSVNSLTSLNFLELPSPPKDNMRWVFFMNRRGLLGCADHSVRNLTNAGVQQVVLGYHCMSTEGELAEAVLSIAGVPAQHNAPDRDYYIDIKEENIIPEKKYLFEKLSDNEWLFHDIEYDFKSAGHFHSFKHSINGRPTIAPQKLKDVTLGESKVLTANDILKIRMLYNYIAKKKLLQAPDCHKLFEPGKKFSQYKPNDMNLKPRPKPFRYTGESSDAPVKEDDAEIVNEPDQNEDGNDEKNENNEDFFVDVPSVDESNPREHDNEMPNNIQDDNQMPGGNEVPDDSKTSKDDDDIVEEQPPTSDNNDLPIQNPPREEDESDNYSPTDFHNKNPNIINIDKEQKPNLDHSPQSQSTAFNPNADPNMILSLNYQPQGAKKKTTKADLIGAWSDFHTDDENDRQFNHKKMNLKFRGVG